MSMPPNNNPWQEAYHRLLERASEIQVDDAQVDALLAALPKRLPQESYRDWLNRGQKMTHVIPFPKLRFTYLTEIQRYAADTRETEDALPEIPLTSTNQQFRLKVETLPDNRLKLIIEALGLASTRYARKLIGIASEDSKDYVIALIRLNADGDGEEILDNTPAIRQALLRPVIGLADEQTDA